MRLKSIYNRHSCIKRPATEEKIYFKVESFVKIRFSRFVEDISLSVVFLKVAVPRVCIKEIDQSIWILASLPMELRLTQVNIETASPIVDLRVLEL